MISSFFHELSLVCFILQVNRGLSVWFGIVLSPQGQPGLVGLRGVQGMKGSEVS